MAVLIELNWARRCAVMLLSLACSSLLAVVLRPVLHDKAQLLPFTLAVIAASTYAGLAAGLITTGLSFLIADFFFVEPVHELLSTRDDYALLLVFCDVWMFVEHPQSQIGEGEARSRRAGHGNWCGRMKNCSVSRTRSLTIFKSLFAPYGRLRRCSLKAIDPGWIRKHFGCSISWWTAPTG